MAKIKKKYSFTNNRQIWRIIPTGTDKIIIEDRDINTKEVFFNCLDITKGKIIFENFQLEEKFWIGIETVYKNIIYFHKFVKPDMPFHKGIIAIDLTSQKISWKTDEYNFLFIKDDRIYTYKNKFDGKEYLLLNYKNGNEIESLGSNSEKLNNLREEIFNKNNFEGYLFPQQVDLSNSYSFDDILDELKTERVITGKIDYIEYENLLLISFHEVLSDGKLRNIFRTVEIDSKKIILEEILDRETKLFIPESFFVKDHLVFLIQEKVKLIVYSF